MKLSPWSSRALLGLPFFGKSIAAQLISCKSYARNNWRGFQPMIIDAFSLTLRLRQSSRKTIYNHWLKPYKGFTKK
jgi:hypothetical protein